MPPSRCLPVLGCRRLQYPLGQHLLCVSVGNGDFEFLRCLNLQLICTARTSVRKTLGSDVRAAMIIKQSRKQSRNSAQDLDSIVAEFEHRTTVVIANSPLRDVVSLLLERSRWQCGTAEAISRATFLQPRTTESAASLSRFRSCVNLSGIICENSL